MFQTVKCQILEGCVKLATVKEIRSRITYRGYAAADVHVDGVIYR